MARDAASFDYVWFICIIVLDVVEVIDELVNNFYDRTDYLLSILLDLAVADTMECYLFYLLADQVARLIKQAGSACMGALIDCKIIVQCYMLELIMVHIILVDGDAFTS